MEGFESDSTFFFVRLNKCNMTRLISQTWQCDPALSHIFAGAVRIAGFTWLVALQEEELARAFVGVDLCGQRRGIGKLQRHMTFPARIQRSDVNDDAAAGISDFDPTKDQYRKSTGLNYSQQCANR